MKVGYILMITLLLAKNFAHAQELAFSKKGGEIKAGDKVVALFEDEKMGFGNYKNFHLLTPTKTPLLHFIAESFKDTTDSPYESWYRVLNDDKTINYTIPMPNDLNYYKSFGNYLIDKKIILVDGNIDMNALQNIANENANDFKIAFNKKNDSMIQLVSIPTQKVARKMSKPVEANDFGNVGQDNTVIGSWQRYIVKSKISGGNAEEVFMIKNIDGGIVCVARRDASGVHIHTFDGIKRKSEWISSPSDALTMPPSNQNPVIYATILANYVVKKGLL